MEVAKLTKGQRDFLKAIYEDRGGEFHIRVVQPMFDAGYVFPMTDNFSFWIQGCNSHSASKFVLLPAGYEAMGWAHPYVRTGVQRRETYFLEA